MSRKQLCLPPKKQQIRYVRGSPLHQMIAGFWWPRVTPGMPPPHAQCHAAVPWSTVFVHLQALAVGLDRAATLTITHTHSGLIPAVAVAFRAAYVATSANHSSQYSFNIPVVGQK